MDLHHRIIGKQGDPLVLLHGLFGSLENLAGIGRRLAEFYQIHLLDLRNHGRSPHHQSMHYPRMANDVAAYMDAAGLVKVHLFGHSMGGKTAMQVALSYPERVRQLVVGDIAPVDYPAHHEKLLTALQLIVPERLKSRSQADGMLKDPVPEQSVRQFLLKNLVKKGSGGYQWRMNLAAIARNYPALMAGLHHRDPYTGRVLFIKGGNSDYIKPHYQNHIRSLFPDARLRTIANTGHWFHAEKPDLVAGVIKRFLAAA